MMLTLCWVALAFLTWGLILYESRSTRREIERAKAAFLLSACEKNEPGHSPERMAHWALELYTATMADRALTPRLDAIEKRLDLVTTEFVRADENIGRLLMLTANQHKSPIVSLRDLQHGEGAPGEAPTRVTVRSTGNPSEEPDGFVEEPLPADSDEKSTATAPRSDEPM